MSVCYKIEARRRSLTVLDQPKWPLSHMCTCVISSLSNVTVMSLSTNSPAEACDTLLLLLVISVCCHFIYNLFVLEAYKIEASRRSLTAIFGDPLCFTKMTSWSLLLYLLQAFNNLWSQWCRVLISCICEDLKPCNECLSLGKLHDFIVRRKRTNSHRSQIKQGSSDR